MSNEMKTYRWLPVSKKWVDECTDNTEDFIQMSKETGCMNIFEDNFETEFYCKHIGTDGIVDYMHTKSKNNRMQFNQIHKRQLPAEIIEADQIEFDETEEEYNRRNTEREYYHIFSVKDNRWYKVKIDEFSYFAKNGFLTKNDLVRSTFIDKKGNNIVDNMASYYKLDYNEDYKLTFYPAWLPYLSSPSFQENFLGTLNCSDAEPPKVDLSEYEKLYVEQINTAQYINNG